MRGMRAESEDETRSRNEDRFLQRANPSLLTMGCDVTGKCGSILRVIR
jgi:hypothetical protein